MPAKATIQTELHLLLICTLTGLVGLAAYAASKFTPGKLIVIITGLGFLGFFATLIILAVRLKSLRQLIGAAGISLASIIVFTYLLLAAFVYFFQDAVANKTSFFFQPKTIAPEAAQALVSSDVIDIVLPTPDGILLRGWLVRNSTEDKTPLVIYFGGSGSESSEMIPFAKLLNGWSVALINYRGFGLSEGTPTQATVLADSLFVYDTITARADIDTENVVVMGYSLGTGVAVYLSDQRPTAGTILVSPYDYWTLIGVKQIPLYAPVSGIMNHYFDSISSASEIETPLLCLAGSDDPMISPELSRHLAAAWSGEATVIEYPGEDHALLFHENSSWTDITNFLQRFE